MEDDYELDVEANGENSGISEKTAQINEKVDNMFSGKNLTKAELAVTACLVAIYPFYKIKQDGSLIFTRKTNWTTKTTSALHMGFTIGGGVAGFLLSFYKTPVGDFFKWLISALIENEGYSFYLSIAFCTMVLSGTTAWGTEKIGKCLLQNKYARRHSTFHFSKKELFEILHAPDSPFQNQKEFSDILELLKEAYPTCGPFVEEVVQQMRALNFHPLYRFIEVYQIANTAYKISCARNGKAPIPQLTPYEVDTQIDIVRAALQEANESAKQESVLMRFVTQTSEQKTLGELLARLNELQQRMDDTREKNNQIFSFTQDKQHVSYLRGIMNKGITKKANASKTPTKTIGWLKEVFAWRAAGNKLANVLRTKKPKPTTRKGPNMV